MLLNEVLINIDIIETYNFKEIEIDGISYHSARVKKGDLFVCIKGYKTDGHKYISMAIEKGCAAIIVEDYQIGIDIPQIKVTDGRIALATCSSNFFDNPTTKMKVIGITATNGKTTTAFMVDRILTEENYKTGLIGTVMIKTGDEIIASDLTTPESYDLQNYVSKMVSNGLTHLTMEVSSSALQLKRCSNVDFDIVTFNNISREHIDLHGSFEEYFKQKSSLITNANDKMWAILNLDCEYTSTLINKTKAKVLTFGVNNERADINCVGLDLSSGRAKFEVKANKRFNTEKTNYIPFSFNVELKVPGYHSVVNSLVAIAIGLLCDVSVEHIQSALKDFKGVERRFELVYEDDFMVIDDHFANIGNIDITLETLKYMKYKKLKLLYAIRGNRGSVVNRENAETIVKWSKRLQLDEIYVTRSISLTTEKDRVTDEEVNVFMEVMKNTDIKINFYEELNDGISAVLKDVEDNDVIMLAGCQGMDHGVRILLNEIAKLKTDFDKGALFAPLKNRVAGML